MHKNPTVGLREVSIKCSKNVIPSGKVDDRNGVVLHNVISNHTFDLTLLEKRDRNRFYR